MTLLHALSYFLLVSLKWILAIDTSGGTKQLAASPTLAFDSRLPLPSPSTVLLTSASNRTSYSSGPGGLDTPVLDVLFRQHIDSSKPSRASFSLSASSTEKVQPPQPALRLTVHSSWLTMRGVPRGTQTALETPPVPARAVTTLPFDALRPLRASHFYAASATTPVEPPQPALAGSYRSIFMRVPSSETRDAVQTPPPQLSLDAPLPVPIIKPT